ncbi:hypothetical protein TthSNM66_18030 [Thermus thermophilus]|uniref:DUF6011 domain-containing protein n=1 Tax=Thermus thermophilus TaxID=274 RepID=UPI001FCCA0F0|nr:DUF6011 domain-containing protein [Thermus thermophilus]BDG27167.1 hypothetical protein TthSNM66_18030 [Thermus thermophilus]
MARCSVCGRELKDPRSIARGMGPVCARKQARQVTMERLMRVCHLGGRCLNPIHLGTLLYRMEMALEHVQKPAEYALGGVTAHRILEDIRQAMRELRQSYGLDLPRGPKLPWDEAKAKGVCPFGLLCRGPDLGAVAKMEAAVFTLVRALAARGVAPRDLLPHPLLESIGNMYDVLGEEESAIAFRKQIKRLNSRRTPSRVLDNYYAWEALWEGTRA